MVAMASDSGTTSTSSRMSVIAATASDRFPHSRAWIAEHHRPGGHHHHGGPDHRRQERLQYPERGSDQATDEENAQGDLGEVTLRWVHVLAVRMHGYGKYTLRAMHYLAWQMSLSNKAAPNHVS